MPYATAPFVARHWHARHCRVHRIPFPTSVTIAIRPSCGNGTARNRQVIWVKREVKNFCDEAWTRDSGRTNHFNRPRMHEADGLRAAPQEPSYPHAGIQYSPPCMKYAAFRNTGSAAFADDDGRTHKLGGSPVGPPPNASTHRAACKPHATASPFAEPVSLPPA